MRQNDYVIIYIKVVSDYELSFKLGSHNVLLEATYDLYDQNVI